MSNKYSPGSYSVENRSLFVGRSSVTPSRIITPSSPVSVRYGVNETVNDFNTPGRSRNGEASQMDPDTKQMIEDAKEDFSNPYVEIFDCDNCTQLDFSCNFLDPVKIECSQDGQTLYYGGENLGVINRKN